MEIEYFLLALLLILMYVKPAFLVNVRNNSMMKMILTLVTLHITYRYGMTPGILMAAVFVLLLNDTGDVQIYKSRNFEGFSPKILNDNEETSKEEEDLIEELGVQNITDLSREFELNTEKNNYNYRYVDNH